MIGLLALHLVAAAGAPALTRLLDRRAFVVLALVPAASFLWLLPRTLDVTDGGAPVVERWSWIPSVGIDVDLVLDPLTAIMSLVVTGVGALVLLYCGWYFRHGDPEIWRFSGVLTAFAGAMLGLVLSDNMYVLFVFWELTTVLSYLLIGHNPERRANRRAAMNALLVTTFGGLSMLVGLFVLHAQTGTPPSERGRRRPAVRARHHRRRWRCSSSARSASRHWHRSTSGSRGPWRHPPPSAPTCTPRPW
ncbi:MAG: proton-conducting transporter membrane subunit [Aeromicrobium erythreum]